MRQLILILALAGTAHATARSVTLLGVSGVGGPHFAELLEQDLGDLYDLVPGEVYHRTAERMNMRSASLEDVRTVATTLRIDAIIAGAIGGEGRTRRLVIVIREGVSGRVVARGRYDLSGRTLPLIRERVVSDMVRVLERVRSIPKGGQPIAEAPPTAEEEMTPAPAESGGDVEPTVTVTKAPPKSELTWRGLIAGVGPAIATRHLSFDQSQAPGYGGGTVFGIRATGAVFPLALSSELAEAHPALASFGLEGSYEHIFNYTSSSATGGQAAGFGSRWYVFFVGRIPLGHKARGGFLTVETGYQQVNWGSKSTADIGVPDVSYGLVDAGLRYEHELGTRFAVFNLRLAYQYMASGGDITSAAQYGNANGNGVDLDVGITAWPVRWLWLRLGARYTPIVLNFAAAGAHFAKSATDQFVDGTLEVGFAL
jgi:hypothetical protein